MIPYKTTKRLASNDLRHRLVKGAVPGFGAGEPPTNMVRSRTSICVWRMLPPLLPPLVPSIPPTESCVVSIAVTKSRQGFLTKCNMALARTSVLGQ